MNHFAKRVLSLLLVLTLCLGILPGIALAEGELTVTFSNNGTVSTQTATAGDQLTLPLVSDEVIEGKYTCIGWTTEAVTDSSTAPAYYEAGATITVEDSITLYALYSYSLGDGASAGYVLTDLASINDADTVVITMTYTDGTTWALNSANGSSKAPAATVVTVSGNALSGDITADLKWNVVDVDGGFSIYPAGSTATWLYCTSANNGVRVGTNTANVFSIDATSGYIKHNGTSRYLGVYRTNPDWRCYTNTTSNTANQTLGFYVEAASGAFYTTELPAPACEHANTALENAADATCTEAGYTGDTVCADCGETVTKGTEIAALGHSFVDGTCTVCGETIADLSGNYYIAAKRSTGNYFYMTSDLGTASTKRYTAVDSGLTELPASIASGLADRTFTLTANDDGTYAISVEGQYLGWTSKNSGTLVAVDSALALTVEATGTGAYTIVAASAEGRNLSLNSNASNCYFAFYTGTQINDLYLIPVEAIGAACEHTNTTVSGAVDATCTAAGYTGDTVCADCGETVAKGEEIAALGHTNEDGDHYCDVCGAQVSSDSEYKKTTVISVGESVLLINEEALMELSSFSTTSTVYGIGTAYTGAPVGLMPLTIAAGASEGTLAFTTPDGLYLTWLSGNSLRTSETLDANSSWTVSFDENGNAVIANSADATRTVRWNKTSPRFACYTSGQADVQLYKLQTADACQHTETTVTGAVAADCVNAGYTGNTVCATCGETVAFGTAIDALGHDTVVDAAVAATCTKGGLTEGSHCSRCDEVTAQKVAHAAGHTYVDGVCSVCGIEEIAAPAADVIISEAYALAIGDALPYTATLTGAITEINTAYSETYQNITVTIAVGEKTVQCYRLSGEGADALAVGDTITVTGNIINYNGTIEFASGCQLVSVEQPLPKEYALVGYINGADYGCNDDYENVGEYIFVDGTLSTSFNVDSYVFVKTTDNANWYLFETYCAETSGTLVLNAPEKMFVPGGVEITFTLVENEDGSLTLSYVTGDPIETEPTEPSEPADPTYYVVGNFNGWNPADEAYLMTANEDGTYALTFAVTAGEIQLKVTGGNWDDGNNWGDNGNNIVRNAVTDGDITVTFDPATFTVTVTGDCLEEIVKEPLVIESIHAVGSEGLFGCEWDQTANAMTNTDGVYTITFTGIAAGTYELKFAANGAWNLNWASGIEMVNGEAQTAWFNPMGNSTVTVTEDNSTVTLTFDTPTMDPITGEGATCKAVIEAEEEEEILAGDVTGDGKINIMDVVKLYAKVKGVADLDEAAIKRADYTGDGKLNIMDVVKLYAYVKG